MPMLFKAMITVLNPMTGESRQKPFQFDPDAMTQQKWNGAYPRFNEMVQELITAAATSEPEKV